MQIQELNLKIRRNSLKNQYKKTSKAAVSWTTEDLLYSGPGRAIFIILPTSGCSWALSDSGGCTMCSYITDSPLEDIPSPELVEMFKENLDKQINQGKVDNLTAIKIFVSGSFLNEKEVPVKARREILTYINRYPQIQEVVIESRPEYIKPDVLKECCDLIPDKIFEISIGMETADEHKRMKIINKGFTNKELEESLDVIGNLKKNYKIRSKVYILVKPILTSEKNAIIDAVRSAIYAEKIGADRIVFCPSTIHKGTLMEVLWRNGSYKPPWIWSIIEIVRKTRESVHVPVVMDTAGFGTRRGPYNCKKCNNKLKMMLIESNLKQELPGDFDCECKNRWLAELKLPEITRSI